MLPQSVVGRERLPCLARALQCSRSKDGQKNTLLFSWRFSPVKISDVDARNSRRRWKSAIAAIHDCEFCCDLGHTIATTCPSSECGKGCRDSATSCMASSMEAFGALELLSRGLGETYPVNGCASSFQDLPLVNSAEGVECTRRQRSFAQNGSVLPSQSANSCILKGQEPLRGGESAFSESLPFSRPISAPPNLGAISASTLFAYPPAESAGCVDFLLNDIRYDKEYCEFYRQGKLWFRFCMGSTVASSC